MVQQTEAAGKRPAAAVMDAKMVDKIQVRPPLPEAKSMRLSKTHLTRWSTLEDHQRGHRAFSRLKISREMC